MAHKHNRRRVRPRRNHAPSTSPVSDILSSSSLLEIAPHVIPRGQSKSWAKSTSVPATNRTRLNDLTAQHWHNRYVSWQHRERQQRQKETDAAKLEADQCRLFGGEPGDDMRDGDIDEHDECNGNHSYNVELDETTSGAGWDEGRGGYNSTSHFQRI